MTEKWRELEKDGERQENSTITDRKESHPLFTSIDEHRHSLQDASPFTAPFVLISYCHSARCAFHSLPVSSRSLGVFVL